MVLSGIVFLRLALILCGGLAEHSIGQRSRQLASHYDINPDQSNFFEFPSNAGLPEQDSAFPGKRTSLGTPCDESSRMKDISATMSHLISDALQISSMFIPEPTLKSFKAFEPMPPLFATPSATRSEVSRNGLSSAPSTTAYNSSESSGVELHARRIQSSTSSAVLLHAPSLNLTHSRRVVTSTTLSLPLSTSSPPIPIAVRVNLLSDGYPATSSCDSSPDGLPACNLRSAWAYCLDLISNLPLFYSFSLSFTIVLPSNSISVLEQIYGGTLLFSSYAAPCNISLSVMSSSGSSQATIKGDADTGLLNIATNKSSHISLQLTGVIVTNFGGSSSCLNLTGLDTVLLNNVTVTSNLDSGDAPFLKLNHVGAATFSKFVIENENTPRKSFIRILRTIEVNFTRCAFKNIVNVVDSVVEISNAVSVTLSGTVYFKNTVDRNGAILLIKFANYTITSGCRFENNTGSSLVLFNAANVEVDNSTFYGGNTDQGAVAVVRYQFSGPLRATFTHCSFLKTNVGGAFASVGVNTSFVGCHFEGNSAYQGGAIYASDTALNVESCNFHQNEAYAPVTETTSGGGAIYMNTGTNCVVSNSTFSDNRATGNGGAIFASYITNFLVASCTFMDSRVGNNGGAVFLGSGSSEVSFQDSTLSRNSAQVHGGAVYFSSSITRINVANSTFSNNIAFQGSGGAIHFVGSCSKISIGGLQPKILTVSSLINASVYFNVSRAHSYYVLFDPKTIIYDTYSRIVITGTDGVGHQTRPKATDTTESLISSFPGIGGNDPLFVGGSYVTFRTFESTSGILDIYRFTAYPALSIECKTVFTGNSAYLSGGAIYWGDSNTEVLVMPATVFFNNSATSSRSTGGAVCMLTTNSILHFYSASFSSNSASTGGALSLVESNYPMSLHNCIFTYNYARKSGGALYLESNNGKGLTQKMSSNSVRLVGTVMKGNNASTSGGAVYVSTSNAVYFTNSVMKNNHAGGSGGALFFDYLNIAQVNHITLSNNTATYGGAMQSTKENNVSFYSLTAFNYNTAVRRAGAISMLSGSAVSFLGETHFLGNTAIEKGGAVFSSASTVTMGPADIVFEHNTASQGSAMRLEQLTQTSIVIYPSNSSNIMYVRNKCTGGGGTVSWVRDPGPNAAIFAVSSPLNQRHIVYRNNIALFGNVSCTQATQLSLIGEYVPTLLDYFSEVRPHPTLHLLDYFYAKDISDSSAIVTASIAESSCSRHSSYLAGVTTVSASKGNVVFPNLAAFCFPGGNMTILFTAQLLGFDATYKIQANHTYMFRQCVDGEILVGNQCEVCPSGSYSLHYDPLQLTNTCTVCPAFTDGCYGATIIASPGYWRIDKRSVIMTLCPYGKAACRGGSMQAVSGLSTAPFEASKSSSNSPSSLFMFMSSSLSGSASDTSHADGGSSSSSKGEVSPEGCELGYEGPLCAVCSNAYYFSATTTTCKSCEGAGRGQLAILILVPLVMIITLVSFTFATFLMKPSSAMPSNDDAPLGNPLEADFDVWARRSSGDIVREWMDKLEAILTPKLKIMTTVFQIVSNLPLVINIQFSALSTKLFHAFSFANFSALTLGSPQCYTQFDYVDSLILQTSVPISLVILMLAIFIFHMVAIRRRSAEQKSEIITRYLTVFFLLTYLVLPSVTTTIFGAFNCRTVDPDNVLPATPRYLRNDLSISCTSSRYYFGVCWAAVMIFVYPIGITSMYAYVLYINREDIINQEEPSDSDDSVLLKGEESARAVCPPSTSSSRTGLMRHVTHKEIKFLHSAYEGKCWYWEIVETIRRLLLTAVLSVVAAGSSMQIVCGIFISVVYIKLYGYFFPFKSDIDDVLQEMAQFQVFITLFISLLIRLHAFEGNKWDRALDLTLITANLATSGVFVFSLIIARKLIFNKREEVTSSESKGDIANSPHIPRDLTGETTAYVYPNSQASHYSYPAP